MDRWDSDTDLDLSTFESRLNASGNTRRRVWDVERGSNLNTHIGMVACEPADAAHLALNESGSGQRKPAIVHNDVVNLSMSDTGISQYRSVSQVHPANSRARQPITIAVHRSATGSLSPALSTGTSATDSESAVTEDESLLDGLVLPAAFGIRRQRCVAVGKAETIDLQSLLKSKLKQRAAQPQQPLEPKQALPLKQQALLAKFRDCSEHDDNDLIIGSEMRLQDRLAARQRNLRAARSNIPMHTSRRRTSSTESTLQSTHADTGKRAASVVTPVEQSDRPASARDTRRSRVPRRNSSSLSLVTSAPADKPRPKPVSQMKTPLNPLRLSRLDRPATSRFGDATDPQTPATPSLARTRRDYYVARPASALALGNVSEAARASLIRRTSMQDLRPRLSNARVTTIQSGSSLPSTAERAKTLTISSVRDVNRSGGFAAPTMASLSRSRTAPKDSAPRKQSHGRPNLATEKATSNLRSNSRRGTSTSDVAASFSKNTSTPGLSAKLASINLVMPSTPHTYGNGTELDDLDELPMTEHKPSLYLQPRFKQMKARRVVAQTLAASNRLLEPSAAAHLMSKKHDTMRWNATDRKWDGNAIANEDFDKVTSSPITRPALITDLSVMSPRRSLSRCVNKGQERRPAKIVGSMMFDFDSLKWVSINGTDDEDELHLSEDDSVLADDEAERLTFQHEPLKEGSDDASRSKASAWERGELDRKLKSRASFALSRDERDHEAWMRRQKFVKHCEEGERNSRRELANWMTIERGNRDEETRAQLWDLRRLVLDSGSPFR
ncbi:hypothetical protein OIV83_000695 [Microbotryomycetes sp. JL201]|nr:hypothetical protein OIV83_000695 [Microbotryomycetes sp. JL201]